MMRSAVIVAMVGAAKSMTCPPGDASIPGIRITVTALTDCGNVEQEMKDRIKYQETKPLNRGIRFGGKYALEDVPTGGTVATSRLLDNGQPTHQVFTLSPLGKHNGVENCKIEACSSDADSIGSSIGSSYCDLKMLYCSGADGGEGAACKPSHQVFFLEPETLETVGTFTRESLDVAICLGSFPPLIAEANNVSQGVPMLALMSPLSDATMAAQMSTDNQSQINASSQQGGLCLAKVDIYENDCREYNTQGGCESKDCFWGQGYAEGKCLGKAVGDETCVNYNGKADCDAQKRQCFWGQGYEKGKCLSHQQGDESMCLKHYTKAGCPAQSCYWGDQDAAELCLAQTPLWENYCRDTDYDSSSACPDNNCFWGPGYESGKCWGKSSGWEESCRAHNARSYCAKQTDVQGKSVCLWGQGYEKGKCLTHQQGYESMCLKYYTKAGCPAQSCYWGSDSAPLREFLV